MIYKGKANVQLQQTTTYSRVKTTPRHRVDNRDSFWKCCISAAGLSLEARPLLTVTNLLGYR